MFYLTIPETEYYNEATGEFTQIRSQTIQLEHSLISISKWESKWHKPFLGNNEKTLEEMIDYVRCMTITSNVQPLVYYALRQEEFQKINVYIEDSMTATWFNDKDNQKTKRSHEVITAEIIYYWMISLQIPLECEKWHLNRLLTLIRVCNDKNTPAKKMSKKEILNRNRALNAARKKRLNTRG